uniref:hypothetical protein n=1 Tax=Xanthomonas sp. 0924 TaxID=2835534 RepID=UPI003F7D8DC1
MATDTQALVAQTALNRMFRSPFFSICEIDHVARMLEIHPERHAYNQLRALHCVHWNEMPEALRQQIPALVQQALGDGFQSHQMTMGRPQQPTLPVLIPTSVGGLHQRTRSFLGRIFGGSS